MAQFEVLRVYLFYFTRCSFFFLKKIYVFFFFFNSRVNYRSK
jgi:hypothetical protein